MLLHCGATWEQEEKFLMLSDVKTWRKQMQTMSTGTGRLRPK
jgi:hypothetical protein